jgi:predicted RNA-binding protein associated with RNAse of E/G family
MSPDHQAGMLPPWPEVRDGDAFHIVKVAPEGHAVTEYPATVVLAHCHGPWVCVEATWTFRSLNIDGLIFEPGDRLLEWFSRDHWYNVFAVYSPDGEYRGSYANVTYPTRFDPDTAPPTLAWHDLYLDLIVLPNGEQLVRDEDELEESGLATSDPGLHERIVTACAEVKAHLRAADAPFHQLHEPE